MAAAGSGGEPDCVYIAGQMGMPQSLKRTMLRTELSVAMLGLVRIVKSVAIALMEPAFKEIMSTSQEKIASGLSDRLKIEAVSL